MTTGKTLIIGASEKPDRYANRAAYSLVQHGHPIEQIGMKEGSVAGNPIRRGLPELTGVETVTLYVAPKNQPPYYEYIKTLGPRRVIFNPGTENPDFAAELQKVGIEPVEACTLVMLSIGTY